MKKRISFNINFTNRAIYTLITFSIFLLIGISVFALTPGVAPNPGHLIEEMAPPLNCETNQVLQWDGSIWTCSNSSSGGGGLQSIQIFTTSGTWTKPDGVTEVRVRLVGGGGGGGVSRFVGGGGGTSIFGSCSATGGSGGPKSRGSSSGGVSNGGIINIDGSKGTSLLHFSGAPAIGGFGGSSQLGGGSSKNYGSGGNGWGGDHYGGSGGGGGGYCETLIDVTSLSSIEAIVGSGGNGAVSGSPGRNGKPGAPGVVIVEEYK